MKRVILLNTTKDQPVRIMAADGNVRLTVITEPRYAGLFEGMAKVVLVDDVEDLPSVRDAAVLSGTDGIDYVISATERTIQSGGYLRSMLGLPGISFDVANVMSNKYAMKLAFSGAGLPVAPFKRVIRLHDLPAACSDMKWPLVVKPVMGTGAINIFIIGAPAEFSRFCRSPSSASLHSMRIPLIAESLVEFDWEFHSEGVVIDGDLAFTATGRYFGSLLENIGQVNGSYMLPAGSREACTIEDLHRRAVAAAGLRNGVTHLQGFRTTAGYVLSEITCRPAGGAITDLVEAQHGVDLWKAFLSASLGEVPAITASEQDATFARCWVPPVPGVIESLATEAELDNVPWVTRTKVTACVGDRISPADHSSSHVAMIIYRAASPAEAVARVEELVARVNFKAF